MIEKYLHPNAARLAREQVNEFASSLLLLAKALAHQRGDDKVMSSHINEALNILWGHRKKRRLNEALIVLGGMLFGAFVSGFVTELTFRQSKAAFALYVLAGMLGLVLLIQGVCKTDCLLRL